MIDLRHKTLPTGIVVGGKFYEIKTDYRVWLDFENKIEKANEEPKHLLNFFVEEIPKTPIEWEKAIIELTRFYFNPNPCPKSTGENDRIYDYLIDSDYVYSAFMECYHINLIKVDLHWHEFLALFRGLTQKTKLGEIMGYRAWKKSKKSQDSAYAESKRAWALPKKESESRKKLKNEIDKELYGC